MIIKAVNLYKTLLTYKEIYRFNSLNGKYQQQASSLIYELKLKEELADCSQLPANYLLKIQWYMAEFMYVCRQFNTLAGNAPTKQQERTYLLAGILIALCDLMVDDMEISQQRLNLYVDPISKKLSPANPLEQLYLNIFIRFKNSVEVEFWPYVEEYYSALFNAQIVSKQQLRTETTIDQADSICRDKCGFNMLFLRALAEGKIDKEEQAAWYEFGAFVQFCNDAQDMHKDLNQGIQTFATTRATLFHIIDDLEAQRQVAFHSILQLTYPKQKLYNFLFAAHLMAAIIYAKLNVYKQLCNGHFTKEKFSNINKATVRQACSPAKLTPYALPKILKFSYRNIAAPLVSY